MAVARSKIHETLTRMRSVQIHSSSFLFLSLETRSLFEGI